MTDAVVRNLCSDSDEDTSEKSTDEDHQRSTVEDLTDVHFKFEVKEVCVCLALMSGHHVIREERVGWGVLVLNGNLYSGAGGADPAGGAGKDFPVLQYLSPGSRREETKLRPERHLVSATNHARLLRPAR